MQVSAAVISYEMGSVLRIANLLTLEYSWSMEAEARGRRADINNRSFPRSYRPTGLGQIQSSEEVR